MTETDSRKYETEGNNIEFDLIKTNYSKQLGMSLYMTLNNDGVFEYLSPEKNRVDSIAFELSSVLTEFADTDHFFTRRELTLGGAGKSVCQELKDRCAEFKRKEMPNAIDYALKMGWLREYIGTAGKNRTRITYTPTGTHSERKRNMGSLIDDEDFSGDPEIGIICEEKCSLKNFTDSEEKENFTDNLNDNNDLTVKIFISEEKKSSEFKSSESLDNNCEVFLPLKGRCEKSSQFFNPPEKTDFAGSNSGEISAEKIPCQKLHGKNPCRYFDGIREKNVYCQYGAFGKGQPLNALPPPQGSCPHYSEWLACLDIPF